MRSLIKTTVYTGFLILISLGYAYADGDMIPEDKALHFGISLGMASAINITCKEYVSEPQDRPWCNVLAAGIPLGAGLAKELFMDRSSNSDREHAADMLANTLGVGLGVGLTW